MLRLQGDCTLTRVSGLVSAGQPLGTALLVHASSWMLLETWRIRMPDNYSVGSAAGSWAGVCSLRLLRWPLPACTDRYALPSLCCRGHLRGSQRHAPVSPGREGSPAGGPIVCCACCMKFLSLGTTPPGGLRGSCGPDCLLKTACSKPVPPGPLTTSACLTCEFISNRALQDLHGDIFNSG